MGRIDYCNSLLYGLPATDINRELKQTRRRRKRERHLKM